MASSAKGFVFLSPFLLDHRFQPHIPVVMPAGNMLPPIPLERTTAVPFRDCELRGDISLTIWGLRLERQPRSLFSEEQR